MLPVYQLTIPTPYPVGPVNVYLIKAKPYTLIDVGPDTPRARALLEYGLKGLGVSLAEIERAVITHSHPDHCGLLPWLREVSGAELIMHHYECQRLTGAHDYLKDRIPLVLETGISATAMKQIMADRDKLPRPQIEESWVTAVGGGELLEFAGGAIEIGHFPGHCPGHICLWEPAGGSFFSGDFLLPHITPNPLLEADPQNPTKRVPGLNQYLEGLDRLEKMPVAIIWPGHGGVFNDHRSVISRGRAHYERQWATIMGILENRAATTFELSLSIYPELKGWEIFLGISEVQANLDLLENRGLVTAGRQGDIVFYALQGANSSLT